MGVSLSASLTLATEATPSGSVPAVGLVWWLGTLAVILGMLLVDLLVVHRHAHVVGTREAARWSAIWIALGVTFAGAVWLLYPSGHEAAGQYLTGYLIEKSLSVDNLFVFVLIFAYFKVPDAYQHRVLFWGILGALAFRGAFIALGAVLLSRFSWVAYLFGTFLVYTGMRLFRQSDIEVHPANNPVLKLVRRVVKMTDDFDGQRMFTRVDGAVWATPLFAVLIVVETTDVVFAVDSIPAIFGVTRDPFLVFASNAFALLGLRALYFLLASAVRRFAYLGPAIALVLVLVGAKLILEEATTFHPPAWAPLLVIGGILGVAIWASLRREGGVRQVARVLKEEGSEKSVTSGVDE